MCARFQNYIEFGRVATVFVFSAHRGAASCAAYRLIVQPPREKTHPQCARTSRYDNENQKPDGQQCARPTPWHKHDKRCCEDFSRTSSGETEVSPRVTRRLLPRLLCLKVANISILTGDRNVCRFLPAQLARSPARITASQ